MSGTYCNANTPALSIEPPSIKTESEVIKNDGDQCRF